MNIAYDGSMLRWQKAGGILRYFSEIISRLPADWEPTVLGMDAGANNHPQHPRVRLSNLSSTRPRRLTQPLKNAYWKHRVFGNADLVHPTYYGLSEGLNYSDIKCPLVVTVYDMIYAAYPDQFVAAETFVRAQREAVIHADHVICISKFTELDLLNRFPEAAGKTSVIHLGCSFPICTDPQPETIFEKPVCLFVGNRNGYKHFSFLLKAFAQACRSHPTLRLMVAGAPLTPDERTQLHALGINDRVDSSVYPDDRALHKFYRESIALLYPSLHEGFGIPPLEAMACGTVAVTSNTTCLPEIVGNGGIMLDPCDPDAWTECILDLARQRLARTDIVDQGRRRLLNFSWENSADQHIVLYQKVAGRG